jgi:hypothetical protein
VGVQCKAARGDWPLGGALLSRPLVVLPFLTRFASDARNMPSYGAGEALHRNKQDPSIRTIEFADGRARRFQVVDGARDKFSTPSVSYGDG